MWDSFLSRSCCPHVQQQQTPQVTQVILCKSRKRAVTMMRDDSVYRYEQKYIYDESNVLCLPKVKSSNLSLVIITIKALLGVDNKFYIICRMCYISNITIILERVFDLILHFWHFSHVTINSHLQIDRRTIFSHLHYFAQTAQFSTIDTQGIESSKMREREREGRDISSLSDYLGREELMSRRLQYFQRLFYCCVYVP